MDLQGLMVQAFERSGERTDLCPYATPGDSATFDALGVLPGYLKLRDILNQAVLRIAHWQYPDGRPLRLASLRRSLYFDCLDPPTGYVISATSKGAVIPGLSVNVAGGFDGWTIEVTAGTGLGQVRVITSSVLSGTNVSLGVHKAWDTVLDSTSAYALYRRFAQFVPAATAGTYLAYHIPLDPISGFSDIVRVRDVEQGVDLERAQRTEDFAGSLLQKGVPSSYRLSGQRLEWDVAPDASRTYEIQYMKVPADMAMPSDEPELPVPYHEAVVLWAVHSIQMRQQDFQGAYATKRDMQELMATLRRPGRFDADEDESALAVMEE